MERAGNIKGVKFAADLVQAWMGKFSLVKSGPGRAKLAHDLLDQSIKKVMDDNPDLNSAITCRKGCSACCNIQVMVSEDEADLLYGLVVSGQVSIDEARLEKQAPWGGDDYPANFSSGEAACVFLDSTTKTCRVYSHRPMACRSYYVASDPELCDPSSTHEVQTLFNSEAACIESAALSINLTPQTLHKKRTLPALLLERITNGRPRCDN